MEVAAAHADDAASALVDAGAPSAQVEELGPRARLTAGWSPADLPVASSAATAHLLAEHARAALRAVGVEVDDAAVAVCHRDDGDWSTRWRTHFKPSKIGRRLWVVPSWETSFRPPTGGVVVRMEPGLAFGTGEHATTAMCLRAVETFVDARGERAIAGAAMLDVGCGSGILAIAGLALGLGRARAIDIDPVAVEVARANAQDNRVILDVAVTPIDGVDGRFDLVVANILAGPLVDMAAALVARTRLGGSLVLGGILRAQADEVQSAVQGSASAHGSRRLDLALVSTHGPWATLEFADKL